MTCRDSLGPEKSKLDASFYQDNYENYLFGNNKVFKLQYLMVMHTLLPSPLPLKWSANVLI
jgi:hypothetical protein